MTAQSRNRFRASGVVAGFCGLVLAISTDQTALIVFQIFFLGYVVSWVASTWEFRP